MCNLDNKDKNEYKDDHTSIKRISSSLNQF
jgi:hypothetical protein